jgi:glycosyltransferase involved in cell wall biosynthesis
VGAHSKKCRKYMKVLHIHFGKDGGAEAFFVNLVRAMARRGVEQKVVIRPNRRWRSEIEQCAVIAAESHFRNTSYQRLWLPMRVRSLVSRWQPDAIMAWMSRAGHLLPSSASCLRCGRLGDYPDRLTQFRHADMLICNTPGVLDRVRNLGWKRDARVITNFTRTVRVAAEPRETLNTPHGVPVICSVGRLVPRKGFDVLVRAMTRVPDAYLWIIGEGPEEGNLRTLADRLGVTSRVRLAGWRHDPRPFVAASDISAMASSHEPLGNVILEGWAQGVPVVATRSEGPTWIVQDGINGILVDIGDHEGFAGACRRVLADAQLAAKLVAGGEASLRSRFSEDSVVAAYLDAFSVGRASQVA